MATVLYCLLYTIIYIMEKIRIGNYIYNKMCEYSNEWIVCGKVVMGIDGEYIEWYA